VRPVLLLVLVLVLVLASSCTTAPWREQPGPWTPAVLEGAEDARVTFADGIVLVMESPHWLAGSEPPVLEGRVAGDLWRVPFAEVTGLETRRTEAVRVVANAVLAVAVVAAVVAVCVCTGSTPCLDGLSFSGPREDAAAEAGGEPTAGAGVGAAGPAEGDAAAADRRSP
jgi:hypothetical protein